MKTKIIISCLLTAILLLSVLPVMAVTPVVSPTSLKFIDPKTQLTFSLTPPDSDPHTYTLKAPTIKQDDQLPILFTFSGTGLLNNQLSTSSTDLVTITADVSVNYGKLSPGKDYSGNIEVKEGTDIVSIPVSFVGSFCKSGEQGTDLEISKVDIDNSDGTDDEWSPLDKITIQVKVSNEGDEKVKDVNVKLALFDSSGKNIIDDMIDLDNEIIELGSIKDDKDDTATFSFIVPADFEEDNYRLAVKAFSDDLNEENLCVAHSDDLDDSFFHSIDGQREEDEDKHIIFHNIKVSPSPAQCGEVVQVMGEIVNVGDADYEEQVKVVLYNQELGLNIEKVVREDFDKGDSESVEFEFILPKSIDEKLYNLNFITHYDYDSNNDVYDISSEETFTSTFRVAGNCERKVVDAQITAELDSETPKAIAGKQVIVNANIKNTGDAESTYVISVSGNADWSNLVSLEPRVFSLAAGESKEVSLVLSINTDATGDKEFAIKAISPEGVELKEQKVSLSLSPTGTEPQLTPFVQHVRNNWFIYLIILINIILIIAIILVIRSMVSPRAL